eukprot:TRINITY_DN85742_c0_g1_i1.p1 TRINITY_DN85742_c0_g1~~TRINITY_DN85742_c0_g1_i1.p1  ORF type:complete len:238 (-),score=54.89 TRINITY_DN85742_c0_g1_i1:75-788(-)
MSGFEGFAGITGEAWDTSATASGLEAPDIGTPTGRLHAAVLTLDAEGVAAALAEGADVNARDSLDRPLAVIAASLRGGDVLQKFIDTGAVDLEAKDGGMVSGTPLLWAVGTMGMTGVEPLVPFEEVAEAEDNAEVVDILLKAGADLHATNKDGETVLHLAASLPRLRTLKFLLSQAAYAEDAALLTVKDSTNMTPLDAVNDQLRGLTHDASEGFSVSSEVEALQEAKRLLTELMGSS